MRLTLDAVDLCAACLRDAGGPLHRPGRASRLRMEETEMPPHAQRRYDHEYARRLDEYRAWMWLWPVAILVSFPIGGYIADLVVDGVDSVGAALAAGLIVGAIIGAAEWFALRQGVSWLWILATTVGMAVGLVAGAALVDYGIDRGDLLLMGAVNGVAVGVLQALVLARHRIPGAFWGPLRTRLPGRLAGS